MGQGNAGVNNIDSVQGEISVFGKEIVRRREKEEFAFKAEKTVSLGETCAGRTFPVRI